MTYGQFQKFINAEVQRHLAEFEKAYARSLKEIGIPNGTTQQEIDDAKDIDGAKLEFRAFLLHMGEHSVCRFCPAQLTRRRMRK